MAGSAPPPITMAQQGDVDRKVSGASPAQMLPNLQAIAKTATETVIVVLGCAYICGFLVVYTFLNRFGIHDSSTELFRVRYVHTGLLCLAFPIFVMAPVAAHLWMYFRQKNYQEEFAEMKQHGETVGRSRLAYTAQLLLVGGCLYFFVLFEPYGQLHKQLAWISGLLFLAVWPMVLWRRHLGFAAKVEHPAIRAGLAVLCLAFFLSAFRDSWPLLFKVAVHGFSYWLFASSLLVFVVQPMIGQVKYWYPGQRIGAQIARFGITITLALLSTFAFAYRLFPLVPADKGGGDYSQSRDARVCFVPDKAWVPPGLTDVQGSDNRCSVRVKVIENTDPMIYVARSDDKGSSDELSQVDPPAAEVWSEGKYFPKIFAIPRASVAFIEYEDAK